MTKFQQPSKECVRNWLRTRVEQRRPLPDAAQIKRDLGWGGMAALSQPASGRRGHGG